MKEYDFVIIGSGLSGLLSGAILSKNGYNVCVVEKNKAAGGNLQNFKRDGIDLETGMHYFGSGGKGQFIYQIFKYLDIYNELKIKRLDLDHFDIINYNEREYPYAQGFDNFTEKLSATFPDERTSIVNFINKIREVGGTSDFFNLRIKDSGDNSFRLNPLYGKNAYRFITSVTGNNILQNVLSGLSGILGGPKENINLYIYGMIYYSFIQSTWRFVGGSGQLANALVKKIEKYGGSVQTGMRVKEFVLGENRNIKYIKTDQNVEIRGKRFISSTHPTETFKMLPTNVLGKSYAGRINQIENSFGMFKLYVILKKNRFKYLNYNYHCALTENMWSSPTLSNVWPDKFWLSTPAHTLNDSYATNMVLLSPVGKEMFRKWLNTGVEKRGKEYDELKTKMAENLLSSVEKYFPGYKASIEKYYTSTPLTFRDYTGTAEGSAFGLIKDSENSLMATVMPKTKIKNLYLTGQNVNAHGMVGVSAGVLVTLSFITDINRIIKKIANAG